MKQTQIARVPLDCIDKLHWQPPAEREKEVADSPLVSCANLSPVEVAFGRSTQAWHSNVPSSGFRWGLNHSSPMAKMRGPHMRGPEGCSGNLYLDGGCAGLPSMAPVRFVLLQRPQMGACACVAVSLDHRVQRPSGGSPGEGGVGRSSWWLGGPEGGRCGSLQRNQRSPMAGIKGVAEDGGRTHWPSSSWSGVKGSNWHH